MARTAVYEVKFRRRREKKTNFLKRLALLKSKAPRLVVRCSNKLISAQVIEFNEKGDNTVASAVSSELKKFAWNGSGKNIPAAYLTGYLLAKKALKKGIKKCVLDIGLKTPVKGSNVFAVLKGAVDAQLELPAGEEAFPKENKVNGKAVEDFAKKLSEDQFNKKFSGLTKKNFDARKSAQMFEEAKKKIDLEGSK
ncbi:MAG TPA: 50S ribosomal protein L18 [archaeon]|nr:50S ribosomal protein L18 [archaeon]